MLSILVSYAYMSQQLLAVVRASQGSVRWLLDSGAFTAFQNGKVIDMDAYVAFVKENGHLFWQCIGLDAVGNADQTIENLRAMRARGTNPMPVLTVDMHVDRLAELVSGECRHVCVAGGVTETVEQYVPRLAVVRDRVGPGAWIHGLGFTRGTVVAATACDSVDSSSWTSGKRWGNLLWFDPTGGGVCHDLWKDLVARPWKDLPAGAKRCIQGMGLNPQILKSREMTNGGFSVVGAYGVFAFLEFAAFLGTRGKVMFFAVSNAHDALCVMAGAAVATRSGITASRWLAETGRSVNGIHEDTPGLAARAADNARNIWRLP